MSTSELSVKDELERLRRHIADLEQSERRRRDEWNSLRESQRWLRTIVQNAPIVVFSLDRDGRFILAEGQGLARLGGNAAELVGRSLFDVYGTLPGIRERFAETLARSGEQIVPVEDKAVYRVWSAPLLNDAEEVIGIHGVAIDITDQHRAETKLKEREEFFATLADVSPTGLYHTDANHTCIFANDRALEIVGLKPGQISPEEWLAALHPEDRERIPQQWYEAITQKQKFRAEYRFRHPDGTEVWVQGEAVPRLDAQGQVNGAVGTITDITALKRAQAEIRSSKDWLETIAATVPGIIAVFNVRTMVYSFVSDGLRSVLGYDPQELLTGGYGWIVAHTDPDDLARVQRESNDAITDDSALPAQERRKITKCFEYRMLHADGSWRWVQTIGTVFSRGEEGQIAEILNVTVDITERREAEEALRRAQLELEQRVEQRTAEFVRANEELRLEMDQKIAAKQRLRDQNVLMYSVLNDMSDGVIVIDAAGEQVLINTAAERILVGWGNDPDAWRMKGIAYETNGTTPITVDSLPMARALRGEVVRNAEIHLTKTLGRDGLWLNVNADPLRHDDGAIRGAVIVFRDDTPRRGALAKLEESMARFDLIVRGSMIGLWDCWVVQDDPLNLDNKIWYSQHMSRLLGYEEHEFGPTIGSWARCVHPEDQQRVFAALSAHLEVNDPYEIEYRCLTKQGEIRWFSARGDSIRDSRGRPERMSGSFIDITTRKQTEQALRDKEIQFKTVLDSTTAVVYIKRLDGRYLFVNREYEALFNVTLPTLLDKTDFDLFPPSFARVFRANDELVVQANAPLQFEENAPHSDGPHAYISVKFPLHNSQGEVYATCGISTDITSRKLAEERLRQEQQFLRGLIDVNERDRQMMAHDIHDGLVQYITSSVMELDTLLRSVKLSEDQARKLSRTIEVLRKAISDGRRVLSGLRPPVLDEAGILVGLEYLIAEHKASNSIDLRLTHHVQFGRLPQLLEVTIFRIVQESLTNIKKHSGASQADVVLVQWNNQIRLTVRDNGQGFDPEKVSPERFGLQGIRKRASLMGGTAEIESSPGHGAVLSVTLPLETPPEGDEVGTDER